jgi:cobyrinic acid a,c-diamide synthase
MREPVSTSAVAMIVSEPPFLDVARRAEEALGLLQRVGVDAAREELARVRRHLGVVGAREARDRVEQDHHVAAVLDQALGLLDDHLGHLHVAAAGSSKVEADDLGLRHRCAACRSPLRGARR